MTERKGDWILTFTGRRFYPLDPRPEDICIEDIAHALAQVNRFGGHAAFPYSVAQHSVLCSAHVAPRYAFEALMHDATEAYLGDVPRPTKRMLPAYQEMEDNLWRKAIAPRFGLPQVMSQQVKIIDNQMLVTEAKAIMPKNSPDSSWWNSPEWPEPLQFNVVSQISSERAESAFLERFYILENG